VAGGQGKIATPHPKFWAVKKPSSCLIILVQKCKRKFCIPTSSNSGVISGVMVGECDGMLFLQIFLGREWRPSNNIRTRGTVIQQTPTMGKFRGNILKQWPQNRIKKFPEFSRFFSEP